VQERPSTEPKKSTQTYESVKECVETNYYGAKRTTEALIPLLQLSDSPRIVNVSSPPRNLWWYVSNTNLHQK